MSLLGAKWCVLPLLLCIALFAGCSSNAPTFTAYNESDVLEGTGGDMRPVDGIDFWEHGDPDRKYRILGTLTENHQHHGGGGFGRVTGAFKTDRDMAIAKAAHKQGGDAVIFVAAKSQAPEQSENSDSNDDMMSDTGQHHHRQYTLVVIKYVE